MDWTKYTTDPCDQEVKDKIHQHLATIRKIADTNDMSWILREAKDKSCLDIGCIEHDLSHVDRPSWKHRLIKEASTHVVGVDIVEDSIKELNNRGFDIRFCDATSEEYLGEKFDIAILGDVIEHVNNPVNLIRFAMRHLNKNGKAIVKTPNPFYIDNMIKYAKRKGFVNIDHVAWYTPSMALEIARRANCNLSAYIVFPRKQPWCTVFNKTDIFTRDYLYVFTNNESQSDISREG